MENGKLTKESLKDTTTIDTTTKCGVSDRSERGRKQNEAQAKWRHENGGRRKE